MYNYIILFKTLFHILLAPMIFPVVYKTCKPFMSEDTKKKIVILSGMCIHLLNIFF